MIVECASSPAMLATKVDARKKYPWDTMLIGKSFIVPSNSIKLKTLINHAYRMGKKLGKVFRVIDHGPTTVYEVGYIGDRASPTGADKFKRMGFKA